MSASTALQNLPEHFQLTPVKGKIPYTKAWQTTSIARAEIENAIASGKATGYGLRLGKPSIGVMALDIDGTAPRALLAEIMGDEELPVTVEFTSGKPNRSQMLFQVSEQYWDALKSKKKTLRNGEQDEDLDFRWNGNQSVLPPSAHPETDGYRWIEGKSPDEVAIAELPTTLLEYWLNLITPPRPEPVGKNVRTDHAKSCDSNPTTIPIDRLLTKDHRESLGGVSEGGRDNTGLELACDLIGVERMGSIECDYKRKNYTLSIEQNARELFTVYCRGCNPPLDERDEERIWNSASQRDGAPSIRDEDAMKNCARSYLKELIGTTRSTGSEHQASASVKNENGCDYPALAQKLGITLLQDERGNPKSKLVELTLNLFNLLGERLKLNQMTNEYEFEGKPLDLNHIKSFISQNLGCDSSTENCIQAVHAIASRFAFHPVRDYLESLKDSPLVDFEVFDNLATLFLGNSDPLANRMLAKTLVGAVARVKKPGTKVDTLTVLQGGQGFLKSTFLKVLAGDSWFCDDIRDLENKDEIAKLARYWLIELAEVDYLMGRKEVESFKRFLSTTADTYRPPYGRSNIRHERTCALFATTNKSEFLKDPTGDRRYWVIEVGSEIDCNRVIENRDLIWATALAAFERGDTWWLNKEEEQARASSHTQYRESDPWSDVINEKFKGDPPTNNCEGGEWLTTNQIFDLLDIPTKDRSRASSNRVTKILKEWGFESKSMRFEEGVRKIWFRSTENVILQNIENIRLQGYKVTEPIKSSSESQNFLLPNLLPNIPNNGIGYSREEERDTPLLPNNSPLLPSPPSTVTHEKPAHCNDSDGECNPVTLLPNISQTSKKLENLEFKVGERVRYIGGMLKYKGQSGEVTKASGGIFETTFTTRSHGSVAATELEVV